MVKFELHCQRYGGQVLSNHVRGGTDHKKMIRWYIPTFFFFEIVNEFQKASSEVLTQLTVEKSSGNSISEQYDSGVFTHSIR